MSHVGSTASSVRRHVSSSLSQWSEHGDMSSDISQQSAPSHHHHHHSYDPEWDAKEELRLRELEEARARAAQMEKTMRWWSDCTANWREKWSKVRTERNKAREESRLLRGKLELAAKECNTLKREKDDLRTELDKLRKEFQLMSSKDEYCDEKKDELSFLSGQTERVVAERDFGPGEKPSEPAEASSPVGLKPLTLEFLSNKASDIASSVIEAHDVHVGEQASKDLQFLDRLLTQRDKEGNSVSAVPIANERKTSRTSQKSIDDFSSPPPELVEQKVAMLQLRLDEASKTIIAERQEKNKLMKSIEKLQMEYNQIRAKYEDIKKLKQDTLKELSQIKAEHQDELDNMRLDLEDEANSRSSLDQRLGELRMEERLQAENASEWGRRERLETETLALERENKKLRTQIEDLNERLERKTKQMTSASDSDVKALQVELHEKNKELADLKHAHGKLKKVLQDKSTELAHALRRSEQYEAEVKKLRGRIEELKKELAAAEDEVDSATNNIRKLQRTNDELQEQVDSLQVQVEHLQSRLRNSASSMLLTRHATNSFVQVDTLSEDDNPD